MSADTLYLEPQSYSVQWPLLGGFIIFGLLIWSLLVWMLTRPPEDGLDAPLPPQAVAKLRRIALGEIDEVEAKVASGTMPARRGHHELSKIVRGFVGDVSGLKASTMTAADLRRKGPDHLARVIETYYPRQFGADESDRPSIGASAKAAREIVGGW